MLQSLLGSIVSIFSYYLTAIPHSLSTEPKPLQGSMENFHTDIWIYGELSLFRSATAFQFHFKIITVNSSFSMTDSYSLFFSNLICYFKSIACILSIPLHRDSLN